ncbi:TetR/AcrR family transcriptional regulator [Apilactobacillus xinyiensis]|uniref:TetR/AcrR family transcriptional regulator C-terminal domain-containing protein n=1 Tax=Apilactobacillus xinyiensis TaxID=2841032 RepID=A0ABT0I1B6_9LACO|nr:TetR/AcrR family transcriptional regulator C-terminal domain-containing protein [Apilactobacillus xinyiensis]MCK8624474.1 TetR/AcrR family transcriptional regulator C-terminal domain-containing protein [Apilactobacillus xinyiensis]MCL0312069.1 TetR/AcrR family transcriptional regulator C-terminal domain-containing protein [Apilactobacillus xinyiensis]MCL0318659.1 TetR/AcrR family transcriptional regulator C-terminal domain-containing protein [Apilactobacillus xinyiensis]MCL0330405.1 TetR/Acr
MKQDERILKTKQAIIDSLIILINQKGFNNIKVTDLTRQAKISRGTFYIHYLDKFDLLNKVETKLMLDIEELLTKFMPEELRNNYQKDITDAPSAVVIKALNYFYDNRQLLAALLSEKGDPFFVGKTKKLFNKVVDQYFNDMSGKVKYNPKVPKDYIKELMMDRLMDIVIFWLKKDSPEKPMDIAKIIIASQHIAPNQLISFDTEES